MCVFTWSQPGGQPGEVRDHLTAVSTPTPTPGSWRWGRQMCLVGTWLMLCSLKSQELPLPSVSLSLCLCLSLSLFPHPLSSEALLRAAPSPGHFPHCPRLSEIHGTHSSIPRSVLRPEAVRRRKERMRTPRASAGVRC